MKRKVVLIFTIILLGLILAGGSLALARNQGNDISARLGMIPKSGQVQMVSASQQSPPVANWMRVSPNGFGLSDNFIGAVTAMEVFSGSLYAGPTSAMTGTMIFRSEDGVNWQPVSAPGFGLPIPELYGPNYWYYIWDLTTFHDQLYAAVGIVNGNYYGGMIVRTGDGETWEPVVTDSFGYTDTQGVNILEIFSDTLYAGTADMIHGAQIWRSSTGDAGDWENVTPDNLAQPAQYYSNDFQVYHGKLFMTTGVYTTSGESQLWFTEDGVIWDDGPMEMFTCEPNCSGGNLEVFSDTLYMGVWNMVTGGELWRTTNGITWTLATSTGDPNLVGTDPVGVFDGYMYLGSQDYGTGIGHLWRTTDGVNLEIASLPGFDRKSGAAVFPNGSAIFNGHFYIGKYNWEIGGSIWRDAPFDFWLPVIHR